MKFTTPRSRRSFVQAVGGAALVQLAAKNAGAKGGIPIAVPGKKPYSIILSVGASPSERWAAEELRSHIARMTGMSLPIDTGEAPVSRRTIAIGRSALTEQLGVEVPEGESCLLKTVGETVIIAGGRQRGTMYGVSLFLEKLGCRWFNADVSRAPRVASIALSDFHEVHAPGFEYREVFFTEAQGREWSARNRLNGHFHKLDEGVGGKIVYMPFAHSYYDLVPPSQYFAGHPEYFALVDGRRRGERAQLCLTNAEVLRLAIARAEQWLRENPAISIVSISQNDGGGWCECEPCRRVIAEEGGAASGLALRFANQVAVRLAVSYPGKMVDMLAYRETADPPSLTAPRPNVQIRFCPMDACQAHSFRTCVYNRRSRERLEGWSRIARKVNIWQYSINFSHYLAPFPNYDELISDLPLFRRAGVSGVFIEGAVSDGGGADDAEMRSYLGARLLWNPNLDAVAEIREFLSGVYGAAGSSMRKYFELRQREVRRGEHLWIDQNVDARYLTPEFLRDARALLLEASAKAANVAARRRIRRHLLSLEYVETVRERRYVVEGASYAYRDPAPVETATAQLLKSAAELNVTHFREGFPVSEQARAWAASKASYAAIKIAEGGSEAMVIPELGRIVALGAPNRLRLPDAGEWRYPDAGGIYVWLFDGETDRASAILWEVASSAKDEVTVTGKSERGRAMRMRIDIAGGALRVAVTVVNPADSAARLRLVCRAEFTLGFVREALLSYRARSGKTMERKIRMDDRVDGGERIAGEEMPREAWTLWCEKPALRVSQRFTSDTVSHCDFGWSFRGSGGLEASLSVASPVADLGTGEEMELRAEYAIERSEGGARRP